MRGRKKTDEMRAAILNCAADVFSQREFHEVLTDDIAMKLGIGKGTIYRYFDSKEDLYFATIVGGLDGMNEAVTAALTEPAPLDHTIERLVRTMLEYFWNRRDFFLLLYRMEPKLDPSERVAWQQRRQELINRGAALLTRELGPRGLGGIDAKLAIEALLGMIRSVCLYRGADDTIDGLTDLVTRLFLHGITGVSADAVTTRNGGKPLRVLRGGRRPK